jgi:hypothetical protein
MPDPAQPQKPGAMAPRKFKTGARPTPRWKLSAATPHRVYKSPLTQIAYVPAKLDMWGNDAHGDCVTAEEAAAKAMNSPEIFIDSATVVAWASAGGFLEGANLTDVMDAMKVKGFQVGQQLYNDGGYTSVDFSNETNLQSALCAGPVKIGIDSSALPSGAGNGQGWVATGGTPQQFTNEDHCVNLCGYGPAGWLFEQLNVPLPSNLSSTTPGYLLYTWSTIGFVDHAWLMSTCGEAWLRNPTTVGVPPLPTPTPTPPPTPTPTPTPPPTPTPVPTGNELVLASDLPAGTYPLSSGGALTAQQIEQALSTGSYTHADLQAIAIAAISAMGPMMGRRANPIIDAIIQAIIAWLQTMLPAR